MIEYRPGDQVPTLDMNDPKVLQALEVAQQYGWIDGDHHKQWVIDQMVRALVGDLYPMFRRMNPDWDEGVAP